MAISMSRSKILKYADSLAAEEKFKLEHAGRVAQAGAMGIELARWIVDAKFAGEMGRRAQAVLDALDGKGGC